MNNYLLQIYFLGEKVSCKLGRENLEHGVHSIKVKTKKKKKLTETLGDFYLRRQKYG